MTTAGPVLLWLVVLLAFTVEGALGFGASVVAVALGSLLVPIDQILPAFVPLNLAMSLILVVRHWPHVARRLLLGWILPCMVIGMPIGIWAFAALDATWLGGLFGAFVVVLSAGELWRMRAGGISAAPTRGVGTLLLIAAGAVHGAFATGGPLAVYVTGRALADKARFRATLSGLWLALNLVLLLTYILAGRFDAQSGGRSAIWSTALLGGLVLGEILHTRVPAEAFRRVVFGLLLVAGGLLVMKLALTA